MDDNLKNPCDTFGRLTSAQACQIKLAYDELDFQRWQTIGFPVILVPATFVCLCIDIWAYDISFKPFSGKPQKGQYLQAVNLGGYK